MGIFTPRENVELDEARHLQESSMTVCPHCQQEFEMSGATLEADNPVLGIKMHRCPKCKQLVTV